MESVHAIRDATIDFWKELESGKPGFRVIWKGRSRLGTLWERWTGIDDDGEERSNEKRVRGKD